MRFWCVKTIRIRVAQETPKIRMAPMITIPISPLVCSVLTTLTLIVTFYAGRYVGKSVMVRQF